MIIVDIGNIAPYNGYMRKAQTIELQEKTYPILDLCGNCSFDRVRVLVLVGDGVCKPQNQYCDRCGWTKDIRRG